MSADGTLSVKVAEEIRAMLGRKRITGRELARRLGVSQPWVSYRLTGHQEIGLDDLDRIARALDVSIADLLPREVRPNERSTSMAESMSPVRIPAQASSERMTSEAITVPDSPEQLTRCAPDVRSSPDRGMRRRPKQRQSDMRPTAQPIPL